MLKAFFFFLFFFSEIVLGEIPAGLESYFDRPDILSVKGQTHKELGRDWEKLKPAHLEAVAMLFESYPEDQHFYFLARDSELLYDYARLAAKNDPKLLERVHLLNISSGNMRDPHLKDYLKQEGISEETLSAGKKVLFVDTGFSGTIPRVIAEGFSEKGKKQLQTHLMCSSNPEHPSSRVFLFHLNPAVSTIAPDEMLGAMLSFEDMPHYSDRSHGFILDKGRWHPISPQLGQSDGIVSKELAKKYQEDLIEYLLKNEKLLDEKRKL